MTKYLYGWHILTWNTAYGKWFAWYTIIFKKLTLTVCSVVIHRVYQVCGMAILRPCAVNLCNMKTWMQLSLGFAAMCGIAGVECDSTILLCMLPLSHRCCLAAMWLLVYCRRYLFSFSAIIHLALHVTCPLWTFPKKNHKMKNETLDVVQYGCWWNTQPTPTKMVLHTLCIL